MVNSKSFIFSYFWEVEFKSQQSLVCAEQYVYVTQLFPS